MNTTALLEFEKSNEFKEDTRKTNLNLPITSSYGYRITGKKKEEREERDQPVAQTGVFDVAEDVKRDSKEKNLKTVKKLERIQKDGERNKDELGRVGEMNLNFTSTSSYEHSTKEKKKEGKGKRRDERVAQASAFEVAENFKKDPKKKKLNKTVKRLERIQKNSERNKDELERVSVINLSFTSTSSYDHSTMEKKYEGNGERRDQRVAQTDVFEVAEDVKKDSKEKKLKKTVKLEKIQKDDERNKDELNRVSELNLSFTSTPSYDNNNTMEKKKEEKREKCDQQEALTDVLKVAEDVKKNFKNATEKLERTQKDKQNKKEINGVTSIFEEYRRDIEINKVNLEETIVILEEIRKDVKTSKVNIAALKDAHFKEMIHLKEEIRFLKVGQNRSKKEIEELNSSISKKEGASSLGSPNKRRRTRQPDDVSTSKKDSKGCSCDESEGRCNNPKQYKKRKRSTLQNKDISAATSSNTEEILREPINQHQYKHKRQRRDRFLDRVITTTEYLKRSTSNEQQRGYQSDYYRNFQNFSASSPAISLFSSPFLTPYCQLQRCTYSQMHETSTYFNYLDLCRYLEYVPKKVVDYFHGNRDNTVDLHFTGDPFYKYFTISSRGEYFDLLEWRRMERRSGAYA